MAHYSSVRYTCGELVQSTIDTRTMFKYETTIELEPGDTIFSLHIAGDGDMSIFEGVKVHGLILTGTSETFTIPENLIDDDGAIAASYTRLKSLPNGLNLRLLDVNNTDIAELPEDLIVTVKLNISHTAISRLPIGVRKADTIAIKHTDIAELPDDIDCHILDFDGTHITHIPDTVKVSKSITTPYGVKVIPDNIKATTVCTSADVIPNRSYILLDFNNPNLLNYATSVKHITFRPVDKTLVIPPHIQIIGVLESNSTIHMHPHLIVIKRLIVPDSVHNIIPPSVILPPSIIKITEPGAIDTYVNNRISLLRPMSKTLHMIKDVFDINFHKLYRTEVRTIEGENSDYDVLDIDLVNTIIPDKKIVSADGYLSQYSSIKRVGDYTVYKLVYNISITSRYIVADDTYWYHCDNIREGIEGIANKRMITSTVSKVKEDLDTILSIEDAIKLYQTLTGACRPGIDEFIDKLKYNDLYREEYSIRAIMALTTHEWGHERFVEALTS